MSTPNGGQQIGVGFVRNRTAAQLIADNYTFPASVFIIESDTGALKIADGVNAYNSLAYSGKSGVPLMTTPVSTVSIAEYGDGRDITSVLTLTNFIIGAVPGAGNLGIGNIVGAFPAGAHVELAYYASLSLTIPSTVKTPKVGLGSVIASGAIVVLNGTATFMDRMTEQTAFVTAPTGGAVGSALTKPTAGALTGIALNTSSSVKNVFLNAAIDWAAGNAGNLTATGTISIKWTKMS